MPNVGSQATTLDVHVLGTNFAPGAVVTWLLKGVGDPAKVRTNYTTYVSPTELIANITISANAGGTRWDVQVALSSTRKGKKGIGTELFTIR